MRRSRLAAACLATASFASPAEAASLDDAGYLHVADRLQVHLDRLWNDRLQRYEPGPGGTDTEVNADLLLVHAGAALAGHAGPARNDARARAVARFLTSPRIWVAGRRPGWRAAPDNGNRHVVFAAEAAEGLAAAYAARRAIRLDAATASRIGHQLRRVTASPQWRWPALKLNQINWYATVFAADATVNGTGRALATNLSRQLARFTANAAGHGDVPGNFGAGLRFHYQPARYPEAKMNFDSPEYASIVLGFSRFYGQARAAGMRRPARAGLLRQWVRRAISGYWTHGGYLNWDTGLGFGRWHQRKKVALARGALIGIAAERELQPSPRWGGWAKAMLDRGLLEYAALTQRYTTIPSALAFGVDVVPQSRANAYLAAAREAANAVRALRAGLGSTRASEPPALYSYDPDTGRLAVTTPRYNTAIVAVNRGAFPYGGLDIARLFDGRQEVAGTIGGTGAAGFGLHVKRGRRTVLRTQYGRRLGASPLSLVRSPRGVGATAAGSPLRAFAGPFTDLRVRGAVGSAGLTATSAYRFTPGAIEGRWSATGSVGEAVVTFPSWGRGARVRATLTNGLTVTLGSRRIALTRVRSLHVVGRRSGYRVTPLNRPSGATVRIVQPAPQRAAPSPGPTLEVALGALPVRFGARLTVDP